MAPGQRTDIDQNPVPFPLPVEGREEEDEEDEECESFLGLHIVQPLNQNTPHFHVLTSSRLQKGSAYMYIILYMYIPCEEAITCILKVLYIHVHL